MPSFAVRIPENGKAYKDAYESDAALRREALDTLFTKEPEYAPLFNGFMLIFQHRDALECVRRGDPMVRNVENPMASELAGFNTVSDDRIYGPGTSCPARCRPPAP